MSVSCACVVGSGKTAAYLLPAIVHIEQVREAAEFYWQHKPGGNAEDVTGVLGLVLAPTRELAIQIHAEARRFTDGVNQLQAMCSYGGTDVTPDLELLKEGAKLFGTQKATYADE